MLTDLKKFLIQFRIHLSVSYKLSLQRNMSVHGHGWQRRRSRILDRVSTYKHHQPSWDLIIR